MNKLHPQRAMSALALATAVGTALSMTAAPAAAHHIVTLIDQLFAGDHFRHDKPGTGLISRDAERLIGDTRHRGQENPVPGGEIANLNAHLICAGEILPNFCATYGSIKLIAIEHNRPA